MKFTLRPLTPLTKRILIVSVAIIVALFVFRQVQRSGYRAGVNEMAATLSYMQFEMEQSGEPVSIRELIGESRERLLK